MRGVHVILVAVFAVVLAACGELDPAVRASVVWSVERSGGATIRDEQLSQQLVGERSLPEEIVAAAACQSLLGHAGDWNVRPQVVVSSRLDLVRVAELIDGGIVDREEAEAIEAVLFSGGWEAPDIDELASAAGVARDEVDEYLEARRVLPSDGALARFAVYAGNKKLAVQHLVVVDRDSLTDADFEAMHPQYDRVPFEVAGDPDEYEYDREDCERLV